MEKILVIEDQDSVRENIVSILKFENFNVASAKNGKEGIEIAEVFLPELIVCDIMMPDMDGYQVLRQLREHPELIGIPFVFLTAKSTLPEIRYGMAIGADDYITKPFSAHDLISSIRIRLARNKTITKVYQEKIKATEDKLKEFGFVDNDTWLPGELVMEEHLKQLSHTNLSLYFIKLENLNYSSVIASQAERLEFSHKIVEILNQFSQSHYLYRIDINKFALIRTDLSLYEIEHITQNIVEQLTKPFHIKDTEFFLRVFIGVSRQDPLFEAVDPGDISKIINQAEMALEMLSEERIGNYLIFDSALKTKLKHKLDMESKIHKALDAGEFFLYYQPKVDIQTGEIFGAEALLRWNSVKGLIMPQEFIHYLEKSGLICPVGDWVLNSACHFSKYLQEKRNKKIVISVNVSGIQFLQKDFAQRVKEIVQLMGVAPDSMEIEITETSLMKDLKRTTMVLKELKNFGLAISLDDFGTGYSSLAYIKQLPLDFIKIDKRFVDDIVNNPNDPVIIQTIVKMAFLLNMDVVAEGVETWEQLSMLATFGIKKIQGFYFSKPVSPEDFEKLLLENKKYIFPRVSS